MPLLESATPTLTSQMSLSIPPLSPLPPPRPAFFPPLAISQSPSLSLRLYLRLSLSLSLSFSLSLRLSFRLRLRLSLSLSVSVSDSVLVSASTSPLQRSFLVATITVCERASEPASSGLVFGIW